MEPRALEGLSTLAPWSMAVNTHLEKRSKLGVKGGLAPLGCLPLWGERGSSSQLYPVRGGKDFLYIANF